MRSARTSVAIITALSLLALPGGALAQSADGPQAGDDEPVAPVYVTWSGLPDYFRDAFEPTGDFPWGARLHYMIRAPQTSDDPRISGTATYLYLGDGEIRALRGKHGRFTVLVRLENDEGAWEGPITEVHFPDLTQVSYGWLRGEGAYEGLSFFTSFHGDGTTGRREGEGVIWLGDPPPVPDPALLDG